MMPMSSLIGSFLMVFIWSCGPSNLSELKTDVDPVVKYGSIEVRALFDLSEEPFVDSKIFAKHETLGGMVEIQLNKPIRVFAGKNCISIVTDTQGADDLYAYRCIEVVEGQAKILPVARFSFDYSHFNNNQHLHYDIGPSLYGSSCVTYTQLELCPRKWKNRTLMRASIDHSTPADLEEEHFLAWPDSKIQSYYQVFDLHSPSPSVVSRWNQKFDILNLGEHQRLKLAVPEVKFSTIKISVEVPRFQVDPVYSFHSRSNAAKENICFYAQVPSQQRICIKESFAELKVFDNPEPRQHRRTPNYWMNIYGGSSSQGCSDRMEVHLSNLGETKTIEIPSINVAPVEGAVGKQWYTVLTTGNSSASPGEEGNYNVCLRSPMLATGSSMHVFPEKSYNVLVSAEDEQGNMMTVTDVVLKF